MTRRTTPIDAGLIEEADDLMHLVQDKRAGWRADGARARRRQRRYKNLLTRQIVMQDHDAGDGAGDGALPGSAP